MSGPLTGTSQITPDIGTYYDRALVSRLEVSCYHVGFGRERTLPKNSGTKSTFAQYDNLDDATTALVDGVTPAGSQASRNETVMTIAWYGDYLTYTDQLDETNVDPNLLGIFKGILAYQAAKTADTIIRNIIVAGTQIQYANGSARTDVNTVLAAADIEAVTNALERIGVPTVAKRINPGTGIGTTSVLPAYIAIGHTDLRKDIAALTGFVDVKDYAQPGKAYPGEIGAVGQIRFILTPQGKIWAGGGAGGGASVRETSAVADVYALVVFGEEFYTNMRLGPKSIKSMVKGFGSAGSEDPLDQRATVGWKMALSGAIQQESRGVRIECACTSLAISVSP